MAVSSTSSGSLKTGVCLSTDRPDNPYNGQVIYETDTNRTLIYDNSAWVVIADPALLSFSGSAASVTGNLTGNVTGDLTGDVAASAVTIGGENVTPYTGRRNLLYNGAMQVAQRSTSVAGITTSGYYTADRWLIALSTLGTWTQSVENDAPDGSGFSKSVKMLCTTADPSPAAGDALRFRQYLEGQDLQRIAKGTSSAQQLTVSFWVKANVTGTYIVELFDSNNSRFVSASYTVASSATWEKKVVTFPADTTGVFDDDNNTSLLLTWWLGAGSNATSGTLQTSWGAHVEANRAVGQTNLGAATNNYWQITGVQLEVGDKATPFEHRSYGEELALCQRYYTKLVCDSFSYMGQGQARTGTSFCLFGSVSLPVMMRSDPALSISGMGAEPNIGATYTLSNSINTYSSRTNAGFYTTRTSGSWSANYSLMLVGTSSSSYVAADAEL